jgi:Putative Flp pilus-assembly TadE/G-like
MASDMRTELGLKKFGERLRSFAGDSSGNILMLFSLTLPVLIGLAAMGSEGGALYLKKSAVQAVADQAAISAANAFSSCTSSPCSVFTVEGKGVAAAMGYVDGQNGVIVTVNSPPASGPNAGTASMVEVIVSTTQPSLLSALFHPAGYVIDGRAVAAYGGGPGCVMALDPTAQKAIYGGGNATVSMPYCNLVSDSSASNAIDVSGSPSVTVNGACGVGGVSANANLVDSWNARGSNCFMQDPYSLSVPSNCDPTGTIACTSQTNGGGATLQPGTYSSLSINSHQVVSLNPGVYIINGGLLTFNGGSVVTGSGVTFVLTNGASFKWNGTSTVNVTGPTSGSFSGVVVYSNDTTSSVTINGTSTTYFGGAIVAPGEPVNFSGTGVSGNGHNCTQIIGDTVSFTGNSTISSDCTTYGTKKIEPAVMGVTKLLE